MNKIYFFSKNEFSLTHNNQTLMLNKYKSISLVDFNDEKINISQNCFGYVKNINVYPLQTQTNSLFKAYSLKNNKYIHLITLDLENLISEVNINNYNIKFFSNAIMLCFNSKCFTYCFNVGKNNYAFKIDNNLYIFNEFNLLKINIDCFSSVYLLTKKLEISSNNYEVLCKIPKNNSYYVLYFFNANNNSINIKKLKKNDNVIVPTLSIPYLVFYLCKLEFDEVKNYLSNNINVEDLRNYFNKFDDIVELDNEFFIYSQNEISQLSFSIINNIVNDID